jgi:deazaflavin-dependent oxidoreductase (nitroreductase family)
MVFIKLIMWLQIAVFRLTKGAAMSFMRGMPVLILNTVGRKSGKARTTPVMYLRDGENYVIIASNNGRDQHPGWYYNLVASPDVAIEIPGKVLEVSATIASPENHSRLWPELVAQAPFFDAYRAGTSRSIPMMILKLR